jgi:hypothetical protein
LVAILGAVHVIYGKPIADTDCGKSELDEVVMREGGATARAAEERVL